MVEPRTGDVKALAQSRPMGRDRAKGETYLNYVVPKRFGDSNGFQAGSTFKAFVLAAAIQKGIPLDTTINAPQQVHIPMSEYPTCGGHNFFSTDVWEPENSTGAGTFDLYTGTQNSVNTFFAQLELQTGLCEPYRLARAMGIDLTDPNRERVPSFTLGVVETSPLEMAEAYATFAGRGLHCASRPVTSIEDADGQLLKDYREDCHAGLRGARSPTRSTTSCAASRSPAASVTTPASRSPSPRPARPARSTTTWRSGSSATPRPWPPPSMIAGANYEGHWVSLNGQTVGGSYIDAAHGSDHRGPDVGRRDEGHPAVAARRRLHPAQRPGRRRRAHRRSRTPAA